MGRASLRLLAAAMIFSLTACGGGGNDTAADPNCGLYNATTAEMWGIEMGVEDIWTKGFSIELKDGGKCEIKADGEKASGKWTLDGTAFTVKGGGFDCSGTLSQGVMTLENVLDMGVNLTFEKEGGFTEAPAGSDAPAGNDAPAVNDAPAAEELSALEQQWDGTWYGIMYVGEATGDFSGIPCEDYDIYTIIDVDADGKGTLDVYLDGVEDAFASASCEAKDYGIDTVAGTIAGGVEIDPGNWMWRQSPDWPGKYVIMDTIEYGDSCFEYYIFIRQWGDSWQADVDTDFEMVPPSWEIYEAAIANGELPPVGFAPHGYAGTGSSSGSTGSEGSSAPAGNDAPAAPSGGSSAAAPAFSGPTETFDYGAKGEIFFDFAPGSYYYEKKFGQEHIRANDESVKFTFVAEWGMDDYEARMQGYQTFVDENNGILEEGLSYGGFDATRVTWTNAIGETIRETYILFGEGVCQYVGINITATADSLGAIESSDLEAILHSVRTK